MKNKALYEKSKERYMVRVNRKTFGVADRYISGRQIKQLDFALETDGVWIKTTWSDSDVELGDDEKVDLEDPKYFARSQFFTGPKITTQGDTTNPAIYTKNYDTAEPIVSQDAAPQEEMVSPYCNMCQDMAYCAQNRACLKADKPWPAQEPTPEDWILPQGWKRGAIDAVRMLDIVRLVFRNHNVRSGVGEELDSRIYQAQNKIFESIDAAAKELSTLRTKLEAAEQDATQEEVGYTENEIEAFTPIEKEAFKIIQGYEPRGSFAIDGRLWPTYDIYTVLEMLCNFKESSPPAGNVLQMIEDATLQGWTRGAIDTVRMLVRDTDGSYTHDDHNRDEMAAIIQQYQPNDIERMAEDVLYRSMVETIQKNKDLASIVTFEQFFDEPFIKRDGPWIKAAMVKMYEAGRSSIQGSAQIARNSESTL